MLLAKESGLTGFAKGQLQRVLEDLAHGKIQDTIANRFLSKFFTPDIEKAFQHAFSEIAPKDKQIGKKFLLAFLTDPITRNAMADMQNGTPPPVETLHGVLAKLDLPKEAIPDLAKRLLTGLYQEFCKIPNLADQVILTLPAKLGGIEKKIDVLLDRVTPTAKPPDFFVPELPGHFVGREGLLTTLTDRLVTQPGGVSLTGMQTVGIYGMVGVGKTLLALKFAHEQNRLGCFDGIYYQFCGDDSLEVVAEGLAKQLGLQVSNLSPDKLLQTVKHHLSQRRALLVLDDVRDPAIGALLPGGRVSTLITTRKKDLPFLSQHPPLDVDEFTKEEALQLFSEMLGAKLKGHEGQAARIADALGRLPIAISVAAGLLRDDVRWTFDRLLNVLEQKREDGMTHLQHRDRNISELFNTAFDRLSPDEEQLLCAMAACAEEGFPFNLAAEVAGLTDTKGAPNPAAYAGLQALVDHSLVREMNREEQCYFLHTLVRQNARNRGPFVAVSAQHEECVTARFKTWEKDWQACAGILGEAREVIRRSVQNQNRQLADGIAYNAFNLAWRIGRMTEASDVMSDYQRLAEALNDKDSLQISYGNQALILQDWGRLEEAMQLHKNQEAICIELGNISSLAYCYWGMASVHEQKGEKPAARQHGEQALARFRTLNMPLETKAVEDFLKGL